MNLGAHTRWCPTAVGVRAHQYGTTAAMLDNCGDMIGATDAAMANRCWTLADELRLLADIAADEHKEGNR